MARKLKTPRRKSVTKPVRRYDTSGRTLGSRVSTRRTPKAAKTELVTSKSGKTYRRPIRAAKPKVRVTPNTVYVAGGAGPRKVPVDPSEVVVKRGKTAIPANYRGRGFRGGFPPSDTTGGAVKQSTQAEIKTMQKQMNAERNMNRAQAVSDAFDERFRALKRKLSGIQGNPGIRAFHGGGSGSKR